MKSCVKLFLDNISAELLTTPGICCDTILISIMAAKDHKDLRRYITVLSLEQPFVTTVTTLMLTHRNRTGLWAKHGPHAYSTTNNNWY